MFKGMGVPVGERALSDMMERFDKDLGGTIEFDEFVEVMNELKPKKEPERWSWGSVQNAVGGMIKKTVTVEQHKLDCAYPLSDIQKVESINICSSESTDFFAHSSWVSLLEYDHIHQVFSIANSFLLDTHIYRPILCLQYLSRVVRNH